FIDLILVKTHKKHLRLSLFLLLFLFLKLQVFREFFIHADSPRRLRRGDSTVVQYRLFNYLYEPLTVQIVVLTDPHLEGPANYVERACVLARSSIARRVSILAKLPGVARLSIKATSVADKCGNSTNISQKTISDEVIVEMQVDPEGVPAQEHRSILLCDKENFGPVKSSIAWNWSKEEDIVPGTETVVLWAVSDFTGPLWADADALVTLPRGCGEQNMARLATNLLALSYLHPQSQQAATAKEHVARGFTRQLQYVHPSGGFSAFGPADPIASTWLTAFCIRYLRRAHQVIFPDSPQPPAIQRAERWLLSQQMENGCFRNEGQVFHKELKGGLNDDGETASIALTAYVITSLIESSLPIPYRIIQNSLSCLRALPPKKTPPKLYAYSIITYAFMRLRRYEKELRLTNEALSLDGVASGLTMDEEMKGLVGFLKVAKRSTDYVWWESGSLATTVESTGYALLALSECPNHLLDSCSSDARRAILWLATHRTAAGGFVSTQDTLVALEGLARWSSILPSDTNLTLRAECGVISRSVNISSNSKVPDLLKMPIGGLRLSVQGTGCALIQGTRFYNTLSTHDRTEKSLQVQTIVRTDGTYNCDTTCFCAAVVEVCAVWSGEFPEMALLEVTLPGGFAADAALLYSQLLPKDKLLRRIEISASNSRATFYLGARDDSSRGGHHCYRLHAVGPAAKTKPAHAKIMDYYRPDVNHVQMFTIPENCPPRISHDATDNTASDNIFNRAKSLDGEILISHDFLFEDIPEGVPMEDPLYDNLTMQTDDKDTYEITKENYFDKATMQNNSKNDKSSIDDETLTIKKEIDVQHSQSNITKFIHLTHRKEEVIKNIPIQHLSSISKHKPDIKPDIENSITEDLRINNKEKNNKNKYSNHSYINKTNDVTSHDDLSIVKGTIVDEKHNLNKDFAHNISADNKQNENKLDPQKDIGGFDVVQVTQNKNEKDTDDKRSQDRTPSYDKFSNFHLIDSERDLEVPSGIEGPVPAFVLPPPNFMYTPRSDEAPVQENKQTPDDTFNPYEIYYPNLINRDLRRPL
ncbi:alpha-2-macroglobulin-like protein 1, partial [Leptidea sinapis]|uniref:alpha-2-macroglobulin-like protein 1 n=1 Tax=Leptidea sinapis TaxID=189913 RepID=UPI0021C25DB2